MAVPTASSTTWSTVPDPPDERDDRHHHYRTSQCPRRVNRASVWYVSPKAAPTVPTGAEARSGNTRAASAVPEAPLPWQSSSPLLNRSS